MNDKRHPYILFVFFTILLMFSVLAMRLFQLQVLDRAVIVAEADQVISRNIALPAKRGDIVDRNGNLLAYSVEKSSVIFDKALSEDMSLELSQLYSVYDNFSQDEAEQRIASAPQDKVVLIDDLARDYIKVVKRAAIPSISVQTKVTRVYPNQQLAAHILGFTDVDGIGLHGLEYTQNQALAGIDGSIEARTDLSGRMMALTEANLVEAINGYQVRTTIDQTIQYYVEEAIAKGWQIAKANKVTAIVQDARNGDILALANFPNFDPNDRLKPLYDFQKEAIENSDSEQANYQVMSQYWSNLATEALYEPGSTFKIFSGLIGLEEGVTYNDKLYYCPGYKEVSGKKIHCWKRTGHGNQTLEQGFLNSCNIVFMDVIGDVGSDKVYQYLDAFQLNEKSDIPLNGEASPLLTPLESLKSVDLARIGFGHNISLTPLQMMKVLSVVSNHGVLTQPRLIIDITDESGNVVEAYQPRLQGRVVSQTTADNVLQILEKVVTSGSGKNAYISGYHIGGKTGTSVKLINGRYQDERKVFSSFAAVVPTNDPVFNVLVIVDEPKTDNVHGSTVATPIAREIILRTLQYLKISPESDLTTLTTTVPNFIGMSLEQARRLAGEHALVLVSNEGNAIRDIDGTRTIRRQYPLDGSLISIDSEIYIELDQ